MASHLRQYRDRAPRARWSSWSPSCLFSVAHAEGTRPGSVRQDRAYEIQMQSTRMLNLRDWVRDNGPGSIPLKRSCEEYDKKPMRPVTPGIASFAIHGLSYFDMTIAPNAVKDSASHVAIVTLSCFVGAQRKEAKSRQAKKMTGVPPYASVEGA